MQVLLILLHLPSSITGQLIIARHSEKEPFMEGICIFRTETPRRKGISASDMTSIPQQIDALVFVTELFSDIR